MSAEGTPGAYIESEGFLVHVYADSRRGRVQLLGRLADGRSFAASKEIPEQNICVRAVDAERVDKTLKARGLEILLEETPLRSFDGFACLRLRAGGSLLRACDALSRAGIEVFGREEKGAVAFLVRNGIRAGIRVSGGWRAGSGVDVVFPDAEIVPSHGARAPLSILSLDIETEEPSGRIRAVGLSLATFGSDGQLLPNRRRALLFTGAWDASISRDPEISVLPDEASLLRALVREMRDMDPDIVTGWNVIDFDFPRLAAAFARARVPFALGRSVEAGIFFPSEREESEGGEGGDAVSPRRSASVFLPGRQVLDALRLVRTGFHSFESYTLDAVAHEILGRGKTVTVEGRQKLAELDRLYAEDPLSFCRYCLNDADLVLDILERKDLVHHTVERAALTGAGIDKAWTSVASFERVYAAGLFSRGVLEPNMPVGRNVSGAAGGTVLEPAAGIFSRVAVFDFRSLYPSVIRTFNVDPLSYERALSVAGSPDRAGELITAPNGARFVREPGILPLMIAEYFEERLKAIARGDDASAYVYKILMNSYYGVLGAKNCRYARTELAGAITSFGKLCLHFARDFFAGRGFRVLYGDTDSVFVELGSVGTDRLEGLAGELNDAIARHIREAYALESFIAIRSEKLYERFFIPRLRSPGVRRAVETGGGLEHDDGEDSGGEDARGRAKGYAGLLVKADGSTEVDIKGMEAARSDYSPLTRRFQRDLLGHLFRDADTSAAEAYLRAEIVALFRGERDGELAFKKKLRRDPDSYVASTPPHVKVARDLGITRRGATVEYVITVNGPEATALRRSAIDYGWYAVSQILPVARSAGTAAGFDADAIVASLHADGQLEFSW